ncbi:MAG: prepilin-type N-terminal cleavage/methylation domain-containing protein [Verrucomicrobiota bacterium]|nr:prepilin-type N-terminal cleavage/methylation domain-containing protein [Verrucomicrobiota bacterium]
MRPQRCRPAGFSLLELAVVVVIIAILAVVSVPVLSKLKARAQRVRCANNLRNLSVAANLFVQQNGAWPQIPAAGGAGGSEEQYAEAWIAALAPFGPTRETWTCPTMQNLLGNPEHGTPETARVDYIATPFDDKPNSPHEWPRQPWFIETGDVHGHGNLIIFTDGSISDLKTVIQQSGASP